MLEIVPISLVDANLFIENYHRHHGKVVSHKFSIGCICKDDNKICGVAIVGRPVARMLNDGYTLEVNRLCTNGYKNACSFLYSACWRIVREMGYKRLVTYILDSESGITLKAVNWNEAKYVKGRSWSCPSRLRIDKTTIQDKIRYEICTKDYDGEFLNYDLVVSQEGEKQLALEI